MSQKSKYKFMEVIKLNNGIEMPILGFGVYQITPEECEQCVLDAIRVGYLSIDTAQNFYSDRFIDLYIKHMRE